MSRRPAREPVKPDVGLFESRTFGEFLSGYVKARKRREPGFSFAVMAKTLEGASASMLAMIARSERHPKPELLLELAKYCGLSPEETAYAETLVGYERAASATEKSHFAERLKLLKPMNDDVLLELDTFALLHEWHNIAILEMSELNGFEPDPKWIARRLGGEITIERATEALALLNRLKLIRKDPRKGTWGKAESGFRTSTNIPSMALRAFHRQMFDKAHRAIEAQPVDQRYFRCVTLAIDPNKIDQAAKIIEEFFDKLKKVMTAKPGDEVYHLATQFFRITEPDA